MRIVGLLSCCVVLCCACEPKTPSASSWRTEAYYAVSDVASDLATAELVLNALLRHRVAGNYAQVTLITLEEDAGKKAQKLGGYQPPSQEDAALHDVSSALSDAQDRLTEVRIAVVRRETSGYSSLGQRLRSDVSTLHDLSTSLGAPEGLS